MELSDDALAEEYLRLQSEGAENINLVTPTHYLPSVTASLKKAKLQGLTIPIVYNCGGYEKAETIRLLDGLADVYLPDMKYCSDKYAAKYSSAPGYFDTAKKALAEMVRQCPKAVFNGEGLMQKGVIVRHLMLPGLLFDTKKIIDYIYREYGNSIWISLMNQYTPMGNICKFAELNRSLPKRAYEDMIDYCAELGMENVFIQEEGTVSESFIPPFSDVITRR